MKLNYNLLKEILVYMEENCDVYTHSILLPEAIEEVFPGYSVREVSTQFKLLVDDGLIDECGLFPNGGVSVNRLTMNGYRALEAMRNDTIWHKIEATVKETGLTELKKIPALAIGLFMKNII